MKNARVVGVALLLLAGSAVLEAKEVAEWNMAAIDMIKADGISNHLGNRTMAMLHVAMFDAVNGIEDQYDPFLVDFRMPRALPAEVAAASAAFEILTSLYPDREDVFRPLYESHIAEEPQHPGKRPRMSYGRRLAIAYGRLVAQRVLQWRENDGSAEAGAVPYPDGTEIGQWRRTDARPPMMPGWGDVLPFAMTSGQQFRLIGPPDITGYEYARDYAEVMDMGGKTSSYRTAEQTEIARFWISGIPRIWNLVAHQVCDAKDYGLLEEARLFALLNVALADAQVVGWDMKYHFGFWRPVTANAYADQDDNDYTHPYPDWQSLLMVPTFPEYPSGHSTSCAAAATVLAKFVGTDEFSFAVNSEANPDLSTRHFNSFWAAARQAGISRVYGGIHFNFSNTEGLEAGRSLGRYICENIMAE